MSQCYTIPSHETYDTFLETMKWGRLIFDSNAANLQQWFDNVLAQKNDELFGLLQNILFQGFAVCLKNHEQMMHKYHQLLMQHHPSNEKRVEKKPLEEAEVHIHTFSSLGTDLMIHLCQFLQLPDLMAFEKTSRGNLVYARNPASLYSLQISTNRKTVILDFGNEPFLPENRILAIKDLTNLGKFRFSNLRRLIINIVLFNMKWSQLHVLQMTTLVPFRHHFTFPKQRKLEELHCSYDFFGILFQNHLIPCDLLKSLRIGMRKSDPIRYIMDGSQYFPALKNLSIHCDLTPYSFARQKWENIMKIVKSISFQQLDKFVLEDVSVQFEDDAFLSDMMYLLNGSKKVSLRLFGDKFDAISTVMTMVSTQHFTCNNLKMNMHITEIVELDDEDMENVQNDNCSLWKMPIWPKVQVITSTIAKAQFNLGLDLRVPYASLTGNKIYDLDGIMDEIEECIKNKYIGRNCNVYSSYDYFGLRSQPRHQVYLNVSF